MLATLLNITSLVTTLLPQITGLLADAKAAVDANDPAALDAVHARAVAAADALKPAGA